MKIIDDLLMCILEDPIEDLVGEGGSVPPPMYLIDNDGDFMIDDDGNYLIEG